MNQIQNLTILDTDFVIAGGLARSGTASSTRAVASHRFRFILLSVIVDIALLELSLLLGFLTRDWIFGWFGQDPLGLGLYGSMAVGILLIPATYGVLGLYPGHGLNASERIRLRFMGAGAMLIGLAVWDYVVQSNAWSRGVLLTTLVYAPILLVAVNHYLVWFLAKHDSWLEPVVIVGAGEAAAEAVAALQQNRRLGYRPIAMLEDDPQSWGHAVHGVPVMGPVAKAAADFPQVQIAIVTAWSPDERGLNNLLGLLPFRKFLVLPRELEFQSISVKARDFGGTLAFEVKSNLLRPAKRYQKLAIDYFVATVGTLVTAPFLVLLAIFIFLVDPGPVLYRQEREGSGGNPFVIYKLRTMYQNGDDRLSSHLRDNPAARAEWEQYFKLDADPRILPIVGDFLRRYSIDELPQLWNVLRGEMAIVGPRPLPDYHVAEFSTAARKLRQKVRPGVTGLWQTTSRVNGTPTMMERLDSSYIDDWSIALDVAVLLDTVIVVLSGKGAR